MGKCGLRKQDIIEVVTLFGRRLRFAVEGVKGGSYYNVDEAKYPYAVTVSRISRHGRRGYREEWVSWGRSRVLFLKNNGQFSGYRRWRKIGRW